MTETKDTKINLCDSCENSTSRPECMSNDPNDIEFGDGHGKDNIISCSNYTKELGATK